MTIRGLTRSQRRCQGKGHALSLGGGHSSPSLFRKKGELPEVSAAGVLSVGPVVSSSPSGGLMM